MELVVECLMCGRSILFGSEKNERNKEALSGYDECYNLILFRWHSKLGIGGISLDENCTHLVK